MNPKDAIEKGSSLAAMLNLKENNHGNYHSLHGEKSPAGLLNLVKSLLEQPETPKDLPDNHVLVTMFDVTKSTVAIKVSQEERQALQAQDQTVKAEIIARAESGTGQSICTCFVGSAEGFSAEVYLDNSDAIGGGVYV